MNIDEHEQHKQENPFIHVWLKLDEPTRTSHVHVRFGSVHLQLFPVLYESPHFDCKFLSKHKFLQHYLLKDPVKPMEASEITEHENTRAKKPEIKLETAPADYRFPTTNQSRHCFSRYVEYHRCVAAKGEGAPECDKFAKYYRSLCPGEWVDRWNEQRENGTFPGPL
ncbi:putative cytochrome-c oxidase [Helianthus anomalus]